MHEKLLKPYDPKETEERIYKIWEESGYFNPDNLPETTQVRFSDKSDFPEYRISQTSQKPDLHTTET
ncbi:MAG: hypothetical protein AAB693_01700, partial [Patescibacteria group bacterium]